MGFFVMGNPVHLYLKGRGVGVFGVGAVVLWAPQTPPPLPPLTGVPTEHPGAGRGPWLKGDTVSPGSPRSSGAVQRHQTQTERSEAPKITPPEGADPDPFRSAPRALRRGRIPSSALLCPPDASYISPSILCK